MDAVAIIYFTYMFVSIYFLLITLLLYFKNKNKIFSSPIMTKAYSISVIIPAFNEEKSIEKTIRAVYNVDYPNLSKVIVVNDGSTDNTKEIITSLSKKLSNLHLLNKSNSGKANSINQAMKLVDSDLVVVIDADSYPSKDCFKKMVGFFDDSTVGAATAACIPFNTSKRLEKLQDIEYKVIAFTRKLLEFIDSIYVTPGTLAMYRKKALNSIGGFDPNNITEDIEATWHILQKNWKVKMAFNTYVRTIVPDKIKPWYRQRRRWGLGGLECIHKYRKNILKYNMLGYFVIPFFIIGFFLGLFGMGVLAYISLRRLIRIYLFTKYSLEASVPVITIQELYITPNVLNFFGLVLFLLFFAFTIFVLSIMKDKFFQKQSFLNLLIYMFIYLLVYPFITISSTWNYLRGKKVWR